MLTSGRQTLISAIGTPRFFGEKGKNGMIERAIANWLTKTNERNYQIPYCQALLTKGHRVLYISSHRPMEQGKDIITVDQDGTYHAYQLKTGNINQVAFRAIKGEVEELVERSIVHPSVDKTKGHKAYLVLNGEITDEVRFLIDQMNEDNRRRDRRVAYLDVINEQGLLQDFLAAQGQFLPQETEQLNTLLKVFNADGTDFLPTDLVFSFFEKGVFSDSGVSKQNARNAIAGSVIMAGYLLTAFQRAGNAYAVFEGWAILAGCMIRYGHGVGLAEHEWISSLELVRAQIHRSLSDLSAEVRSRTDFLEGDFSVDGAELYGARLTIVLGVLSAWQLDLPPTADARDCQLATLIAQNKGRLFLWGESAFPLFFSIIKYLESAGEHAQALDLLTDILGNIASAFKKNGAGLAPPYYSASRVLAAELGVDGAEPSDLIQSGGSFILKPTLQCLARRGARDQVAQAWKKVSLIPVREFTPTDPFDLFSWRVPNGTNVTNILERSQSWTRLQAEAREVPNDLEALSPYQDILRYFTIACPHRATSDVIKLLDT